MNIEEIMQKTKDEMSDRCRRNIEEINYICAYNGGSFSEYKDCFNASKEWLRNGTFI